MARAMRNPDRARLTSDAWLLLSFGVGLLVRHALSSRGWLLLQGMRTCLVGIAVLAIVLNMDLGLLDGLSAARGQADRSRVISSQP